MCAMCDISAQLVCWRAAPSLSYSAVKCFSFDTGLEGRIIRTHIVRIDKRYALVDTGFKKLARFDRRSLRPSQLLKEAEGGEPRKPGEFRAGDQLEFKITDIESAFGDMQISSNILPDGDRFDMMWEELEEIQAARKQVCCSTLLISQHTVHRLLCRPKQRIPGCSTKVWMTEYLMTFDIDVCGCGPKNVLAKP